MKNKNRFLFPVLILLSLAALAMKKFMIPFHGFFLIVVFDGMALFFLMKAFRSEKMTGGLRGRSFNFDLGSIVYGICSIAILYRLEYWEGWERWISVAGILFLIVTILTFYTLGLIIRLPDWNKKIRALLISHLPWIYFAILFTPVALCKPRTFHNLFNGSTFESYVRTRYPADEAVAMIELYKPLDGKAIKSAEAYLNDAFLSEKDEEYEKALDYYNESIDMNPDNALALYRRGKLKLTRMEISSEMAESAFDDFSRAIQLDSNMAVAYYHRAVAHNYLYPKKRLPTRNDLLRAKTLDTSMNQDVFINGFLLLPLSDSSIEPATGGKIK
ncbi:MAG: hypothetical protein NTV09_14545 [Bacteroidetes bacterium]|nr:hypothetical protein [Bacteroidota bacterium]